MAPPPALRSMRPPLLLLATLTAWTRLAAATASTPLSATVLLLGSFDWERYDSQTQPPFTSRCVDMVWRAASLGSPAIQFVPTLHWRSAGAGGDVQSYCWVRGKDDCRAFDQAAIESFKEGMRMCLEAAVAAGFTTIHITPHLDNGDGGDWTLRTWRNGLIFDPLERYGGYSYEEIMLIPLAQVMAPLLAPKGSINKLYFALQGEMGATVMRYPNAYQAIIPRIKTVLLTGTPPATPDATQGPSTATAVPTWTGELPRFASGVINTVQRIFRDRGNNNNNNNDDDGSSTTSPTIVMLSTAPAAPTAAPTPTAPTATALPAGGLGAGLVRQQQQAAVGGEPASIVEVAGGTGALRTKRSSGAGGAGGGGAGNQAEIKFGLTFNFVYSDGAQGASSTTLLGALQTALFGWAIGSRPGFNAPAYRISDVEALIKQCDFIGISAYASLNGAAFPPQALQNSAFNLMDAFDSVGINLKQIMNSTEAELHYVEFGIGGGLSQSGVAAAQTPEQASLRPYWGVQGAYTGENDPWMTREMTSFRRSFYNTTLTWLEQGGGPTYPVPACFVWAKASWDVFGIYPESTTELGSYGDVNVIEAVTTYNQRIKT